MMAFASTATPSVTHNTNITKRPKLSLETSSLPIALGRSSTDLARACSTASPTVHNTFRNAYVVALPLSVIETPSVARLSHRNIRFGSLRADEDVPYQLPRGLQSILRNSPLAKMHLRRASVSVSAGAISEQRRVYFPAKKQVSFRHQLEEEIKTVLFVARHSDLESDAESESEHGTESGNISDASSSQSDELSSSGDDADVDESQGVNKPWTEAHSSKKKRKSIPSQRQIRAAALRDGLDEDQYTLNNSSVPSQQSRRKRRCQWE
jgi:hypothetical protein